MPRSLRPKRRPNAASSASSNAPSTTPDTARDRHRSGPSGSLGSQTAAGGGALRPPAGPGSLGPASAFSVGARRGSTPGSGEQPARDATSQPGCAKGPGGPQGSPSQQHGSRRSASRDAAARTPVSGAARGTAGGAAPSRPGGQALRSAAGHAIAAGCSAAWNTEARGRIAGSGPADLSRPGSSRPAHGSEDRRGSRCSSRSSRGSRRGPSRRAAAPTSHFPRAHGTGAGASARRTGTRTPGR